MAAASVPSTPEEWAAWKAEFEANVQQHRETGREAVLARMGYRSYENYRTRKLWKTIRMRVLVRDKGRCFRCGGAATEVHHDSYDEAVLRGEDDSKLFPLCDGCHHVVEFNDHGSWRSEDEKSRILRTPDTRAEYPRPRVDLRRDHTFRPRPPEWDRMNAIQRSNWEADYAWQLLVRKHPNWETERPERFAQIKARYERIAAHGRDVPRPSGKRKQP